MGSPEHSHGEGPLAGVKVLEMAGLGPTPFGCMLLADLGADVIRVDRVADVTARNSSAAHELIAGTDYLGRGRRRVAIELKHPEGVELVMALVERADVLVEGFRPGTMERLGLGPDSCRVRNPRLVYARMTGWGQDGPLARAAGHDINYIALSGALSLTGASGEPRYRASKRTIVERARARLPDVADDLVRYTHETLDTEATVREAMMRMDDEQYEGLLRPIFKDDEWMIIAVGAVLGFLVGELQVLLLTHV
jgi:CoA-transferase family III